MIIPGPNGQTESCPVSMLLAMATMDQAILAQIEQHVLQPKIIAKAIKKALTQLHAPGEQPDARRVLLQKEIRLIEAELARLTTAIASGGRLQTLLVAVQEREARRTQMQAELALLNGLTIAPFDAERTGDELHSSLKDWSGLRSAFASGTRAVATIALMERLR